MRIVFCGTPQFAVPTLKHLLAQPDFEIAGVITQPDRPRGRGQELSFSPVKEVAKAAHLPVHQPEKIRAPEAQELLKQLSPDGAVIIAYGQIIPAGLLSIPRHGWINLHASLLPKYRGAAPINWAIVNGETRTGATTIRIDAGTIAPRPQNHAEASYAPMLKKEDGRIDWNRSAREIYNRMRGLAPWPGTYTTFRGQACHVLGKPVSKGVGADMPARGGGVAPGTLFGEKNELFVMCGDATVLRVMAVKVEGRKQVSASEFANGARLKAGERFGNT